MDWLLIAPLTKRSATFPPTKTGSLKKSSFILSFWYPFKNSSQYKQSRSQIKNKYKVHLKKKKKLQQLVTSCFSVSSRNSTTDSKMQIRDKSSTTSSNLLPICTDPPRGRTAETARIANNRTQNTSPAGPEIHTLAQQAQPAHLGAIWQVQLQPIFIILENKAGQGTKAMLNGLLFNAEPRGQQPFAPEEAVLL